MLGGIAGSLRQSEGEALQAAVAAFGLLFQALHGGAPGGVVVVAVDEVEPQGPGVADGFGLADFVFFVGENIGVVIEQGRPDAVGKQAFDDGGRTRGTAGVQQYLVFGVGGLEFQHHCIFSDTIGIWMLQR